MKMVARNWCQASSQISQRHIITDFWVVVTWFWQAFIMHLQHGKQNLAMNRLGPEMRKVLAEVVHLFTAFGIPPAL